MTWLEALASLIPATAEPVIQIAADGRWETASSDVHEVAEQARESIAAEVLWPGQVFVGVRWSLTDLREAISALERLTPSEGPVAALTAMLGSEPRTELALVEVGAVNAWQSTGSEVIWRAGQPTTSARLDQRPDLLLCAHPVAVEFAALLPRPHWIGLTVSIPDGGRHRLDERALNRFLGSQGLV